MLSVPDSRWFARESSCTSRSCSRSSAWRESSSYATRRYVSPGALTRSQRTDMPVSAPAAPTTTSDDVLPSVEKGRARASKASSGTTPAAGGNSARTSEPTRSWRPNRRSAASFDMRMRPKPSNASTASLVSERSPASVPETLLSPMPSTRLKPRPVPAIALPRIAACGRQRP